MSDVKQPDSSQEAITGASSSDVQKDVKPTIVGQEPSSDSSADKKAIQEELDKLKTEHDTELKAVTALRAEKRRMEEKNAALEAAHLESEVLDESTEPEQSTDFLTRKDLEQFQEKQEVERRKDKAMQEFYATEEGKLFSPEQDPDMVRFSALTRVWLDTNPSVKSKEEIKLGLQEAAKKIITSFGLDKKGTSIPLAGALSISGDTPHETETTLTPEEQRAAQSVGMSNEDYAKLKRGPTLGLIK